MTATETAPNFRIRLAFWALGAALGLSQAWLSRLDAADNTVSYLDMGDYFFHGHYSAIINGFWSPLYAFLIGLIITVLKPSPYWEYPTVHLLMFITFLFAMACFDYFLRQSMRLRSDFDREKGGSRKPDWVWITIGYTLFLWSSLQLIGANNPTPDMLLAGFFYLSCGLLVTISTGRGEWESFLALGLVLGLSYLTKFAVFPISLLILVTAWLAAKQKARSVLISAVAFIAITAPFIAAISIQAGRFTYYASAAYEIATTENGVPSYHWQGDSRMELLHPTRQIYTAPATYEFKEPSKGTYPPEYDLTYWYQGVKPRIHIGQEIKVLATNLFYEFETLFYALDGVLLATLFLALYETDRGWLILEDAFRFWFLILPCVAMGLLFALVYYSGQYLAASFVVLLVSVFLSTACTVAVPKSRLLSGVAILQFAMFCGLVGVPLMLHARDIHPIHARQTRKTSYQQVAEKAAEMGLRPGDEIASLNKSNSGMAMWARLARVRIIAEVFYDSEDPEVAENNFWNADPLTQEKVIGELSQTGARAVVSQDTPSGARADRWLEIGATGYYLYWLKPQDSPKL